MDMAATRVATIKKTSKNIAIAYLLFDQPGGECRRIPGYKPVPLAYNKINRQIFLQRQAITLLKAYHVESRGPGIRKHGRWRNNGDGRQPVTDRQIGRAH